MEKVDSSEQITFTNYMNNYITQELDKGLTLKYFGEINGKLGIASKKITKDFRDNFYRNGMNSSRSPFPEAKKMKKMKLKKPLPDLKNEKIIIISNKNTSINNTLLHKIKPQTKINQNLKKIDVYGELLENINFEVQNNGKQDSFENSPSFTKTHNQILKRDQHTTKNFKHPVPLIFQRRERIISASEKIDPQRYRKKKVNIEEILQHHNSMQRRDMISEKISFHHLKRSVGLHKDKQEINYGEKIKISNNKLVNSIKILNIKNIKEQIEK